MKINLNKLNYKQTIKFRELFELNKKIYINHIDELYDKSDKSLAFILSSITSRDLYLNDLLIKFTELSLLQYYLNNYNVEEVIIYDKSYISIIKSLTKNKNVKIVKKIHKFIFMKLFINIFYNLIYILFATIIKSNSRRKKFFNTKNVALLTIPVIPSMFKNNSFHDRYYPGIDNYFKKRTPFYYPIFVTRLDFIKLLNILSKEKNIICEFDIVPLKTYFKCFVESLSFQCKYKSIYFREMDVTSLVNNQIRKDYYSQILFKNLITYYSVIHLCKNNNIQLLISWFENQLNNRAFNIAANQHYNNIPSIGYQGFIVSESFFYFHYPTKYELSINSVPNAIAVIGCNIIERVSKYTTIDTILAPSFRYNKIFNCDVNYHSGKLIIISLPIEYETSERILKLLSRTTISSYREKVVINYHPALNVKNIINKYGSWFKFSSLQFHELVTQSSLVISNSSSVCIEAIAYAVPVIIINNLKSIDMNPIPKDIDKFIWGECNSKKEFEKLLNEKYCNYDKLRYEAIARYVRDRYFVDTTSESIKQFLLE